MAGTTDVSQEDNDKTARMLEEQDGRVLAITCDVTSSQDVQAAFTIGHALVVDGRQTA